MLIAAAVLCMLKFSPRSVRRRAASKPASTAQTTAPNEQSIAVLPFHAINADKDSGQLADGIHDEILSTLARKKGLKVISQGSVLDPRLDSMSDAGKGEALGVTTLMEGSLQRNGHRFHVNARLIEARSGKTLYARTFDSEESDLFDLQSRIAQDVAAQCSPITRRAEMRRCQLKIWLPTNCICGRESGSAVQKTKSGQTR